MAKKKVKETEERVNSIENNNNESQNENVIKANLENKEDIKETDNEKKDNENEEQALIETNQELIESENFDNEKLEKIKNEIKDVKNKKKVAQGKEKKYKNILINIIIAIVMTVYFALVMLGEQNIPEVEFTIDLKTFIIFTLFVSLLLFEISYKKDLEGIFLNGIEVMGLGGITIYILDIYSKHTENIIFHINIILAIVVVYYLLKSLVIGIRKSK